MPYTVITLGEFLDQLAVRLNDPDSTFFSREELQSYTLETLRTWAAHTGYWVRRAGFLTSPGQKDYNLPSLVKYQDLSAVDHYPLALEVTDRDMVNILTHALLEPPVASWGIGWAGTEQFSLTLVVDAVQSAVNTLQQSLGLVTILGSQIASPTPISQYDLPADMVGIRSLYWQTPEGEQLPLSRQDQYIRSLVANSAPLPDSYSMVATSPRRIELSPPPTDTGTLTYIYSPGHLSLLPQLAASPLHIPTNFSWAAKWYALFTLLNAEGERRDKFRADYCTMRIKDAMALAKVFPSILRVYIDGEEAQPTTTWDQDAISPTWRNILGTPNSPILHSFTTLALSPVPTTTTDNPLGQFSITFDVAENPQLPSSEASYLDLGPDIIQPLLDYAHHLACFKLGGQEFADSIPSYERFLRQAMAFNLKLAAESNNFQLLKPKQNFPYQRKPTMLEENS